MAMTGRVTYCDELRGDGAATPPRALHDTVTTTEARTRTAANGSGLPPTDIPAAISRSPLTCIIKHERTAAPQPRPIAALQMGLT